MKNLLHLIMLCAAFLTSCTRMDTGKEITVKPNENYYIDYHTYFSIDSIHDYRCPADLDCVWAGNVDIFLTASDGSALINILAQLYSDEHNPVYIGNYSIRITEVLPHLKTSDKFNLPDERIRIIISKN